jgi:hypothetical protein
MVKNRHSALLSTLPKSPAGIQWLDEITAGGLPQAGQSSTLPLRRFNGDRSQPERIPPGLDLRPLPDNKPTSV